MAGVSNNQNYTEDEIREMAGYILGFKEEIKNAKAGVGQLTTFNQLGFKGVNDKPDGWYLPDNTNNPAIILEVKSSLVELKDKQVEEIKEEHYDIAQKEKAEEKELDIQKPTYDNVEWI